MHQLVAKKIFFKQPYMILKNVIKGEVAHKDAPRSRLEKVNNMLFQNCPTDDIWYFVLASDKPREESVRLHRTEQIAEQIH